MAEKNQAERRTKIQTKCNQKKKKKKKNSNWKPNGKPAKVTLAENVLHYGRNYIIY